jgi:hypothetical protein
MLYSFNGTHLNAHRASAENDAAAERFHALPLIGPRLGSVVARQRNGDDGVVRRVVLSQHRAAVA